MGDHQRIPTVVCYNILSCDRLAAPVSSGHGHDLSKIQPDECAIGPWKVSYEFRFAANMGGFYGIGGIFDSAYDLIVFDLWEASQQTKE